MFRKILIANRGEIAVRIVRACRDLGISPSPFIPKPTLNPFMSDFATRRSVSARRLPPRATCEFPIIEAAIATSAEAIHPGYGFLAENADFAAAVAEAGLALLAQTPKR